MFFNTILEAGSAVPVLIVIAFLAIAVIVLISCVIIFVLHK